MGVLVLTGWAFNIQPLIRLLPSVVAMNPMTAVGFVLAGVCCWILNRRAAGGLKANVMGEGSVPQFFRVGGGKNWELTPRPANDFWTFVIGGGVATIGLLRLLESVLGLDLRVDQLLFPNKVTGGSGFPPSEMAPNTALNFLLCGLALLLFDVETRQRIYPSQGLILVAGWVALLAIIGYTYRVLLFYRLGAGLPMSLDTAVGFALFCGSFLSGQPARGVLGVITSRTTGGAMARRLLPMAVLIPWGLGAMLLVSEEAGYFGKEFAVSIFAVASIILFTFLLWWNAKLLYQVDIERTGAENQLRQASANLQRSNTDLQQFAYLASHDLFEPLRMVSSYLQLLEHRYKGKLDPQASEFIHFAIDGAGRMEALINDLLAYSRVDMRGRTLEPTESEKAFESAMANLKVAIEESGATVSHEPLPAVMGDIVQLTQLFQNLIGNAIKFRGPRPPRVEVRAQRRDSEWVFSVHDNGIGIQPKDIPRLFVIFQRLHTRQEYAGTGMGLAICKKIVERHGGRIWVESALGEGSTFLFALPVMG